jgi:hypothetical protein
MEDRLRHPLGPVAGSFFCIAAVVIAWLIQTLVNLLGFKAPLLSEATGQLTVLKSIPIAFAVAPSPGRRSRGGS